MTNRNNFIEKLKTNSFNITEKTKKIEDSLKLYYSTGVKESYKSHFSEEYAILKNHFNNMDFLYEGRIKNPNSLEEKIHRKLYQQKSGNIYDIFAKKIIIYSVNGFNDEETLTKSCYEIRNFLNTYHQSLIEIPDKCKDYISIPKDNGYQAIHILRKHLSSNNPIYCSETQIRTFRMEEYQKFGTASHMLSYKPSETLKKELCPIFLEIGKNGKTYELSEKDSFEKYKSDYDALKDYFYNSQQK